jgi:hypothetical protein
MSATSVHLSDESLSNTVPPSPGSNIQSTFPSISPTSALSIFQIIEAQGVSDLVRAVTYGLASTIHARDVTHHLEIENLKGDNATLQQQVDALTTLQAAQESRGMEVNRPEGYIANNGYVNHLAPTEDRTLVRAKWVKLRDDGAAELLVGRSHDKDPYVVNLYTSPDYTSSEPVEPLPAWFTYLINGPAAEYHAFRDAVGRLDKWEYLAEVEHIRRYAEKRHKILNEVKLLNAELQDNDDKFAACCHRIEAAHIPDMVHGFEQRPTRPWHCRPHKYGGRGRRVQLLNKSGDPF